MQEWTLPERVLQISLSSCHTPPVTYSVVCLLGTHLLPDPEPLDPAETLVYSQSDAVLEEATITIRKYVQNRSSEKPFTFFYKISDVGNMYPEL